MISCAIKKTKCSLPDREVIVGLLEDHIETLVPTAVRKSSVGVRTEAVSAYLSWSDLDVEVAPLVGDLEYLRPCEAVDSQAVSVDEQTVCTDTQHDVNPLRVLPPGCKAATLSLRRGWNSVLCCFLFKV